MKVKTPFFISSLQIWKSLTFLLRQRVVPGARRGRCCGTNRRYFVFGLVSSQSPSRRERSARRWGLTSLLTCHNKTVTACLSLTPPLVSVTLLVLTTRPTPRAAAPSECIGSHRWKASQVKLPLSPPLERPGVRITVSVSYKNEGPASVTHVLSLSLSTSLCLLFF